MSRVVFRLINYRERGRAARFLANAPDGCVVEFKRDRRSVDQNAAMWAKLTDIAQQVCWYGQHLTAEDWKDVLTASLRQARVVPGIEPGSFVPLGMRTSDMTKSEFNDLLALIDAFGAERGVIFHDKSARDAGAERPVKSQPASRPDAEQV